MGAAFPHLNPYQHSELSTQKLMETKIVLNINTFFVIISHVRMAEWSKAPDSR
jgi:hypothetical protein